MLRIIAGLLLLVLGAVGYVAMRRYRSTNMLIAIISVICVIYGLVLLLST